MRGFGRGLVRPMATTSRGSLAFKARVSTCAPTSLLTLWPVRTNFRYIYPTYIYTPQIVAYRTHYALASDGHARDIAHLLTVRQPSLWDVHIARYMYRAQCSLLGPIQSCAYCAGYARGLHCVQIVRNMQGPACAHFATSAHAPCK